MSLPRVSIIIPAYQAEDTLGDTLESLKAQTCASWEAIVVDDGSTDRTREIARRFAAGDERLRVVGRTNGGESAARNTGLAYAAADWLVFLDSDDWLLPTFLERMVGALRSAPEADVLHCGWTRVARDGRRSSGEFAPAMQDFFPRLARSNCFAIHACAVRRSLLNRIGRFDVALKTCADWDFWQRVARAGARFVSVPVVMACYRLRPDSAGTHATQLLVDAVTVISRGHRRDPRVQQPSARYADGSPLSQAAQAKREILCWAAGLSIGRDQDTAPLLAIVADTDDARLSPDLVAEVLFESVPIPTGHLPTAWGWLWAKAEARIDTFLATLEDRGKLPDLAAQSKSRLMQRILRQGLAEPVEAHASSSRCVGPAPLSGMTPFSSHRLLDPVSAVWGYDRGLPVDRYYIEGFLARHRHDVMGRVLEIGSNIYTRRFGADRVTGSDVLDVMAGGEQVTIVGDLTQADHIPGDTFNCVVLTQTLQYVYDLPAALRTLHRILKPGGVLLATFPGVSQTEWQELWYWRMTPHSARQLFQEAFRTEHLEVAGHGNVLAACALMYGLAAEELTTRELDHNDSRYDVVVTVRAVKAAPEAADGIGHETYHVARAGRATEEPRALVLLYHRVTDEALDPWRLSVSPERFDEQLSVLVREGTVVRLREALSSVLNGTAEGPLIAITFDDGYADNLYHALPILQRHGLPATLFACAGPISQQTEFWWDALERILLSPSALPSRLDVRIQGEMCHFELSDSTDHFERALQEQGWRAWEPPPTSRHALYATLWQRLRRLDAGARALVLDQLLALAGGADDVPPRHPALGTGELRTLAGSGLVDVGAHTMSHPALSTLPVAQQKWEIEEGRAWLEAVLERRVASFSYPFGKVTDYSRETLMLVRDAGFECACSNIPGVVRAGAGWFEVPRVYVGNWSGREFSRYLREWLNG